MTTRAVERDPHLQDLVLQACQADVGRDEQLSTYALALREGAVRDPVTGLRLGAPAKLTLYVTESDVALSTMRSSEQLEEHREGLIAVARRIRSGDFAASPGEWRCGRCEWRRVCPSRLW